MGLKKNDFSENKRHYECDCCKKLFGKKISLTLHIFKFHMGEKPFECKFKTCDKKYSLPSALLKHYENHEEEINYACEKCDQVFSHSHQLKRHMKEHSDKKYKCEICLQNFLAKDELKLHIKVHTSEKPFECTKCEKSFSYKESLKYHLQVHTDEKIFKKIKLLGLKSHFLPECSVQLIDINKNKNLSELKFSTGILTEKCHLGHSKLDGNSNLVS